MSHLCIAICTHNRAESLSQTLNALARAECPEGVKIGILVIANACTDSTKSLLALISQSGVLSNGMSIRWLEEPTPGKSQALNLAIREAGAEVLSFIDDDQIVANDFFEALIEALRQYPNVDIFCGKMRPDWDGTEPAWVHATGEYRIPIRPFPEYDYGETPLLVNTPMRLPSGGNITVRKPVFAIVGCFSLEYGPKGHNLLGGEDHEFLRRAMGAGSQIMYVPTIKQLHAIEPERMATLYMMKKSYMRSFSNELTEKKPVGIRPYMLVKLMKYAMAALFSLGSNRRFHYLIRLSATLGEIYGRIVCMRKSARAGMADNS